MNPYMATMPFAILPLPNREARRGHKRSVSTPSTAQVYSKRPLPPVPARPSMSSTRSSNIGGSDASGPSSSSMFSRRQRSASESNTVPPPVPRHTQPPTSQPQPLFPASNYPMRGSVPATAMYAGRRSSQKVYQLTGHDVDVYSTANSEASSVYSCDEHPEEYASPVYTSPLAFTSALASTADYGQSPDSHLVPVLEADADEPSSRESSWGPMSPDVASVPLPLAVGSKSRQFNDLSPNANLGPVILGHTRHLDDDLNGSFTRMRLDDDLIRPWDPAYGQFSDTGAAGEYHRFTAQLASRHSRQVSTDTGMKQLAAAATPATGITAQKKKRSSLSMAFSAASKLSRKRDNSLQVGLGLAAPTSLSAPTATKASSAGNSPRVASTSSAPPTPKMPLASSAPPRPPPLPVSAWDSDSDDDSDDGHVMASLREWFVQRTTEDNSHKVGGTDSFMRPKDRAKQIQAEKAEKRREELRKQIKIMPEGTSF